MASQTISIAAGADDAHESDSGANFTSTATNLRMSSGTTAAGRFNAGMRFILSASIPSGSTIETDTNLTVVPFDTSNDDTNINIYAEDAANPVDFSSNPDVTSRVITAASVAWIQDTLGALSHGMERDRPLN